MKNLISSITFLFYSLFALVSTSQTTCTSEKGWDDFPFTENGLTVNVSFTGYSSRYAAGVVTTMCFDAVFASLGPTITTNSISNVTESTASGGGKVVDDRGEVVSTRGLCWNTTGNPTILDETTDDGPGTGNFTSSLTGLSPGTTYYVKAYATNSVGTSYGEEVSFTTKNNMALHFDGNNDFVRIEYTEGTRVLGDLTIELWANYETLRSQNTMIVKGEYGDENAEFSFKYNYQYCFKITSTKELVAFWEYGNSGSNVEIRSSVPADIKANEWHHFVFVRNSTEKTVTFYCDGKQLGEVIPYTQNPELGNEGRLYIGSEYFSLDSNPIRNAFNGSLDEIRIWNNLRSASDIRENMMRSVSGSETNLVAYYKFDQLGGGTLPDISGNGNNGILNNMDASTDWIDSEAYTTWLGVTNSDWATASNWSAGVPSPTDNVGIYKHEGRSDVVISGMPTVNNILISSSASPTFASDAVVYGNLILETNIDLNGNTITLGSRGTLIEDNGFLAGESGFITTTRDLSGISEDVAGLGAKITTSADMGSTAITRGVASQKVHNETTIKRYFDISPTNNSGLNATLVFNYHDNELNGINEELLELFKSNDNGSTWINKTGIKDTVNNTLTLNNIDDFSLWTAVIPNDPPVANNDTFQVHCGETVTGNVLNNDIDAEGDDFEVVETPTVSQGSFDYFDLETGEFVYRAPLNYGGEVTFSYRATDGALSNAANVFINVVDTIAPTFTVPADIYVYADADQCGTVVNYQEEELDVSQPTYTTGIAGMLKSQSFKAVESGKLVKIQLFKNGVGAYEITLSIYNGDGVGGEVLYSANYSIDYSTNGWFDLNIPFDDAPFLTAGNDYTFSLSNDDINVLISAVNPYASGRFFSSYYPSNLTHDLMFKTYLFKEITASDNAGYSELEQTNGLPSGSVFPVGETINTFVATDAAGNNTEKSFKVIVEDNTNPLAIAHDTTIYLNADGIATISVESVDVGSYDNCSIDTMYLSQDTFDCSYVGYIPANNSIGLKSIKGRFSEGVLVGLTAEDIYGNMNTDLFYVTVKDTVSPEVRTKDITVYLDESGMVVIDSLAVDNGSKDACGLATFELSRDTFYCENVGENTVTMTVTDMHGNVSSATALVTVADAISPTVLAHDTTLYLNTEGIATISVESIDAGSYDNCSIDTMYFSQDAFDCSYVGYVPEDNLIGLKSAKGRQPSGFAVWLTAIDVNGNTGRDIFYVNVEDTIAPEVVTKDIVISLGEDGIETISTDMVVEESYDACGVESLELSQSNFKGTDVGANKIVITATDVNGNQSFYTSVVTVRDTIAPELWCQNFGIILDEEGSARIYPSFALDSTYDAGGIASFRLDEDKFNCTDIGENIVTLTVKDYGGNAASCASIVNVVDVMEPEVLCKDVEVALNAQGIATIDPTMVDAGSTDVCGIADISLSKSEFTGANLGENQVDLLVTDKSGNTASCTATITVTDEIAPEVTCNAISIGLLSATYELTKDDIAALTAGSHDNATPFDSLMIEVSPNSFSCEDIGDSVLVTVSISDQAGNTAVCETKVYVDFPVIEELADVETTLAAGSCEGTVDYPEILTLETCATMILVEGLGADGVFPLGTTKETWTITAGSITDTVSFNVEVKAENALPILDSVADVAANEDVAYVMQLTGISDGGDCVAQKLSVTATSADSDLIADIAVDYTSPASTAQLSITFVANESGEAEIVVLVEDEVGAAITDTFTITVNPVNDSPVLVEPLADQEVRAGSTLELVLNKTLGVLFDDIDNDELNWSATLLEADTIPSWTSIDETAEDYVIGFSPAEPDTGCYSIEVTVQDADGAEATDTFEVCITGIPVGIEEIGTTNFEVKIYPNPTRGKVNVEYDVISQESVEIVVHSASGGEVFRKEYGAGEAIRFDLSGEVSGMYLVIIRQGDRQISEKLILDRK